VSSQAAYDKVGILGLEVDAITNTDAIDYICKRAQPGQPAGYVIKPYVEFVDRAHRSHTLRDLLNHAELSLCDGVAITWAAHYLYAGPRSAWRFWLTLFQIVLSPGSLRWPLPDRTAGTNFTWPLLEQAGARKLKVFLVGQPAAATIEEVAQIILRRVPGLNIAGTLSGRDPDSKSGRVSDAWLEQTAATIGRANPDIILVGMGFPLQERVCAYLAEHLDHGVFIGEGGTFDYDSFGGPRRKAPTWLQRIGLEWLWRLALEPRRLTRQLAIPRFIYRVWRNR
jgi:N-acetylglucosaminyldiphosphoundecaprenol N-acetyl-beta-D-mannosaminyltransferase